MGAQSLMKNGGHMVQLEILRGYTGAEGAIKEGQVITVDERRAREILGKPGRARVVQEVAQPAPEAAAAKKSSSGSPGGRRRRTRKSGPSGEAAPSSASQAAPASTQSSASTPGAYGAAGLTFES